MQSLKHDSPTASIPILIFSGLPQANEGRLKNEGAAGYFEKSRLMEGGTGGQKELIELIEDTVRKSRDANQREAQTNSSGAAIV